MRFLAVFLCALMLAPLFAQQSGQKGSVLVLKDGREIFLSGSYEVIGDEVQFYDHRGQLTSLQSSQVDIPATEARNEELREGDWQRNDGPYISEVIIEDKRDPADKPPPITPQPRSNMEWYELFQENQDPQVLMDEWQRFQDSVIEETGELPFRVLIGVIFFTMLISFVTNIYIIIKGFEEGLGWGLSMLLSFLCLYPLNMILTFCFILIHLSGNRLKILILWLSFYLAIIGLTIASIIMSFTLPFFG